jgi:hypothetical protein
MKNLMRILGALAAVLALSVGSLAAQAKPEAIILSPEPGERLGGGEVLVAVSFIDPSGTLDPTSLRVNVSGQDVSAQAQLRGGVLVWRPTAPLPPGPQRVSVTSRDRSGGTFANADWTFNVTTAAAGSLTQPIVPATLGTGWQNVHGSVIAEGYAQSTSGTGTTSPGFVRQDDFLPRMWLTAGGSLKPGYRYTARVHVSGYEDKNAQPVNRYRFDFNTPFMTVSAGDVNPVFQSLILAGRRVRGAQGELIVGPLRLNAVYGQTKRAIGGTLNLLNPTQIDRPGTWGQNLLAVRPAIGSGEHFQLGLTVLHVRDDTTSLGLARTLRTTSTIPGLNGESVNPPPKDNIVAGLDLTVRAIGGRLLLQYENAASLLANDITGGALTQAELNDALTQFDSDSLDIDPASFDKWFIFNASLTPLDPTGMTSVAHQVRGSLRTGMNTLSAEWRTVGTSYFTLGQPSLPRDLQGIRIDDQLIVNSQLVLTAGFDSEHDNLDDAKLSTLSSQGIRASANWQASPDGVTLTGTVRLGTRSNVLPTNQSGSIDEKNTMLSAGTSIPVGMVSGFDTRLNLSTTLVKREDPSNPTVGSNDVYFLGGVAGQNDLTQAAVTVGFNKSDLTGFSSANTNIFRVVGTGRREVAANWAALFDGGYTKASSPVAAASLGADYKRIELIGGAEYEWATAATVSLNAGMVSYTDNRFTGRDTREMLVRLRVSRAF